MDITEDVEESETTESEGLHCTESQEFLPALGLFIFEKKSTATL